MHPPNRSLLKRCTDIWYATLPLPFMAHPTTIEALRALIQDVDKLYWNRLEGRDSEVPSVLPASNSVRAEEEFLKTATLLYQAGQTVYAEDAQMLRNQAKSSAAFLTEGIWSLARAIGQNPDCYHAKLKESEAAWCDWFLGHAEIEVRYMQNMLDRDGVGRRFTMLVSALGLPSEAKLPLHHLFVAGPVMLNDFNKLTGVRGGQSENSLLVQLTELGLVWKSGQTGPVSIAFPREIMEHIFPGLI